MNRLNPFAWSFRTQWLTGFLTCVALLAYAWYEQFALDVEPCPLCIFQRLVFIVMGILFLVGAMQNPQAKGRRVYSILLLLAAGVGVGIAAYHLWVQHRGPDPFAGCPMGFNAMVETYSLRYAWAKTIERAFLGEADCAVVNWTLLGLSMPGWTLICYVLLGGGALWAGFRRRT